MLVTLKNRSFAWRNYSLLFLLLLERTLPSREKEYMAVISIASMATTWVHSTCLMWFLKTWGSERFKSSGKKVRKCRAGTQTEVLWSHRQRGREQEELGGYSVLLRLPDVHSGRPLSCWWNQVRDDCWTCCGDRFSSLFPLILPGTLEIQITEVNFWLQCVLSLLSLFGASPEPQITGVSDSAFFPGTKYVVSLPTATNSPNIH